MAKLKKAIIVGPAFPLRGGIANFNEALCRSMNQAGIHTEIVSFSLQYPSFLFPGKTQFDTGAAPADLRIRTIINSVNPVSWFRAASWIKKQKPDLVIFRFWIPFMGPSLGTIAGRLQKAGIRVIAITDNVIPHEHRPGDHAFTRYFINRCDGFIAMSRSVLDDLSKFTSTSHKRFLPHPIYDIFGEKSSREEALQVLNLKEDQRYLLFFGFIRKYKGLDLLLEAMGDERVRKLDVSLIVAGEFYEDSKPYLELIASTGIGGKVILRTQYIPSDQVRYYFSACDMVTQPYRSATQSGVTQIAYHFEKPMLVTNTGGLPEIVAHNQNGYVTAIDPVSIADAIVDFFSNNRYGDFVASTITEKKKFLWSSFVEGLNSLYEEI